jgi:hypothetical protein
MVETEKGKQASAGNVKGLTFVETVQSVPIQPAPIRSQPMPAVAPPAENDPWNWEDIVPTDEVTLIPRGQRNPSEKGVAFFEEIRHWTQISNSH